MSARLAGLVCRLWKCWQCNNEVPNGLKRCPNCR